MPLNRSDSPLGTLCCPHTRKAGQDRAWAKLIQVALSTQGVHRTGRGQEYWLQSCVGWCHSTDGTDRSMGDPGVSTQQGLVAQTPSTTVPGQSQAGGRISRDIAYGCCLALTLANGRNACLTGAAVACGLSSGRTGAPAKRLNLSGCKTGVNH